MPQNAITPAGAVRRAPLVGLTLLAVVLGLAACGGGGGETTAVPDKEADVEVINEILGRQTAAVAAYDRSLPNLGGRNLALAEVFRAQEQEHMDALVKALRGLGGDAEPAAEEIEASGLRSEDDYLRFLYELESATIDAELSAISKLTFPWPRSLLASIVASQAQHLTVLRRQLGSTPLETVPSAFENGTQPAP